MIQLIKLGILVACFSAAACMNTTTNNSMSKDTQTQGAAGNLDSVPTATTTPTPHE